MRGTKIMKIKTLLSSATIFLTLVIGCFSFAFANHHITFENQSSSDYTLYEPTTNHANINPDSTMALHAGDSVSVSIQDSGNDSSKCDSHSVKWRILPSSSLTGGFNTGDGTTTIKYDKSCYFNQSHHCECHSYQVQNQNAGATTCQKSDNNGNYYAGTQEISIPGGSKDAKTVIIEDCIVPKPHHP